MLVHVITQQFVLLFNFPAARENFNGAERTRDAHGAEYQCADRR